MEDIKYCVYMHTNKINGKKYIGQTYHQDDPSKRWGENGTGYYYNDHFTASISKYGWDNFDHMILKTDLSKGDADYWEDYYINLYDTMNSDFGYNLRGGGSIGLLSDSVKQKISVSTMKALRSPEINKKLSDSIRGEKNGMYGKHHSEETKKKISEAFKGKSRGYKWMTNDVENVLVKIEDIQDFINDGWKLGRKHFSEDIRKKISDAQKGRKVSEETKQKISDTQKGRKLSEEHKKKLSEAAKGNQKWLGKHHSEETKEKISKSLTGKKCMTNGIHNVYVHVSEIEYYESIGYKRGMTRHAKKE